MEYILVFINTHNALNCEKVLENKKINITVMPTPSYISNSCGISIKIKEENLENVKELINEGSIQVKFIYDIKNKQYM